MPHPGRVVHHHPPQTNGIRYLAIIHYPDRSRYRLQYAPINGEELLVEGSADEVLGALESGLSAGPHAEAAHSAVQALRRYIDRRMSW